MTGRMFTAAQRLLRSASPRKRRAPLPWLGAADPNDRDASLVTRGYRRGMPDRDTRARASRPPMRAAACHG